MVRRVALLPLLLTACVRPPATPTSITIGDAREPFDAGPFFEPPDPDPDPDPDPPTTPPCTAVDVLFVVDDSGPDMADDQAWIRDVLFPDLGALVWESGDGIGSWRAAVTDACPTPAGLHQGGARENCDLHDGVRWVDGAWEDWLDHGQCVLDVQAGANNCTGESDDEQPATTAARALNPPWSEEVNAGFVRPEALLVVFAATDEDEQPTEGATIELVHEYLLAVKGGDHRKVVFVGMGGGFACAEGPLGPHADASQLRDLVDMFGDRGEFLDACGDLTEAPHEVLDEIDEACARFNEE